MTELNQQKLDALVKKLQKEQKCEKPFFSYGRDIFHKKEPCYFCGFTGNNHGEGRYIYSPLSEFEGVSEKELKVEIILFCGECEKKIDGMDIFDMNFE